MSIFVVIQQDAFGPQGTLADRIATVGVPYYLLSQGVWLVSNAGTARDTCEKLGISEGETGTGVVTEVGSYFGRANPAIWSWIKQNWEGSAFG